MKKYFAFVLVLVLAFGLVGCGTSSCDDKDIAKQGLDIVLKKIGVSSKELGAYVENIRMLDKEKNICSADIGTKAYDNIKKELQKEDLKQQINQRMSKYGEFGVTLYLNELLEKLLFSEVLKIMGVENSYDYKSGKGVGKDGKPLNTDALQFSDLAKIQLIKEALTTLSNSILHYKVVIEGKDELIYAELKEGSEYYADIGNIVSSLLDLNNLSIKGDLQSKSNSTPQIQNEAPKIEQNLAQSQTNTDLKQQEAQNEVLNSAQTSPQDEVLSPQNPQEIESKPEPVNFEQKFGKRIYLATKDDYVNLRKAPSGEIITPIYKKDFEAVRIYSLDTDTKWLKVSYFPAGATSESEMISGYIHISQIAK